MKKEKDIVLSGIEDPVTGIASPPRPVPTRDGQAM
jgi:hypothetical protein